MTRDRGLGTFLKTSAYINQIETAVPPYEGHQSSIDFLSKFITSDEERLKFNLIARRLGIEKRYTVLEHFFGENGLSANAFYRPDYFPTTEERMERYRAEALPLAEKAVSALLQGRNKDDITHLILTSCTGFYAPGLDIDIVNRFGLNPSIQRTLIGYMGCYASIPGLKLAKQIVQADKNAKVMMVNLELCTLHWRKGNIPFDQFVSFLLFSDGCAVSLISAEQRGLSLEDFYATVFPDSLDLMGWTIGNDGFFMKLDANLPKALVEALRKEEKNILRGQKNSGVDFWAIHPGGRSILDGVKTLWDIPREKIQFSYEILRNYGNMSSPTLMFILKRLMEEESKGQGCAMAFGPGLVVESFRFKKV